MATTPPHQITKVPTTPLTPLHGPKYDDSSPKTRFSARLKQKRGLDSSETIAGASRIVPSPNTPQKSTRSTSNALQSPGRTPRRKPDHKVQVYSPSSPNTESPAVSRPAFSQSNHLQSFNSSSTQIAEGMLPTPIKTPRKKAAPKTNIAPRALFHEVSITDQVMPSPRKGRKNKRYNGFSLESFRADDGSDQGQIQIFTDSCDQVPLADSSEANPFVHNGELESVSKKIHGTVKRRKVSVQRHKDPQVEDAIRNDEGMVYVFRGKKVYRRFDDTGEEEEEIDPDDASLCLAMSQDIQSNKPIKTLTRKSIKPTRLFQTEEQKRNRELEKEEEVATDIDDIDNPELAGLPKTSSSANASSIVDSQNGLTNSKKASPFDSWPRLKVGSGSKTTTPRGARGRKRAIPADQDFQTPV